MYVKIYICIMYIVYYTSIPLNSGIIWKKMHPWFHDEHLKTFMKGVWHVPHYLPGLVNSAVEKY